MPDDVYRSDMLSRLKTIKGHITGIEKMIEEKKQCQDILLQIAAVRASVNKVGLLLMEEYAKDCFLSSEEKENLNMESVEKVIKTIVNYVK